MSLIQNKEQSKEEERGGGTEELRGERRRRGGARSEEEKKRGKEYKGEDRGGGPGARSTDYVQRMSSTGGEEANDDGMQLGSEADDVAVTGEYLYHKTFNDRILYLTNMFGVCVVLKNGGGFGSSPSPFVTDFLTTRALLLALSLYTVSLATADAQTHSNVESDPDEAEFTNNITVVCGTLVLTLQLFLLVPAFGWLALVSWTINLVRVLTKSWCYLKRLYQTKVAAAIPQVVDEFKTLKELIVRCLAGLKTLRDGDTTHETEEENGRP